MGTANDDIDKIKYNWAYFMPCVLLINNAQAFWPIKLKAIYEKLYKDILITTRKTLAASLLEIVKLIDMKVDANQVLILEVINAFLSDIDEIKAKVLPNLGFIVA